MLKGIFNDYFLFYPSNESCPSLRSIGKPPWSLWLNPCLKFTAWLRDLTDNCICGVQRLGSHSKIILNTIIAHRVNPCNVLCEKHIWLLNLFRLAITKGLNTYWLKTLQLFIFLLIRKHLEKHNYTLTLCGIVCRPMAQNLNLIYFKFRL